jgi:putative transcriptional regulator
MVRVILKRQAFEVAITRKNLSQKGLSQELKVSRSYLSQIISGKQEPSAMMRQKLLDYFKDCSFDDLFAIEVSASVNHERSKSA